MSPISIYTRVTNPKYVSFRGNSTGSKQIVRRFAKQQKEEAEATTDFTPVQLSNAEEQSEVKIKTVSAT